MKIIRDAEGREVGTVTSNHGFLKFVGVMFGIGLAVEVFASGNVVGILALVAVIVILIVGSAIRRSQKESEDDNEGMGD